MANKVQLGKSDVKVFPIALGTNAVGGHNLYPNLDEEQGKEVVRKAIDNGITLLDTAYIYGPNVLKNLLDKLYKNILASKFKLRLKDHMSSKITMKLYRIMILNI